MVAGKKEGSKGFPSMISVIWVTFFLSIKFGVSGAKIQNILT